MSASTVSITAPRRRPAATGEKKSAAELLSDDGDAAAAGGAGDDNVASGGVGKDLSHSIRGEAVLERSRDPVQSKKALPNSATALPRRTTRKGVSKSEKPFWKTVMSVFAKNLLLLLALLGLSQVIRKLALNSGPESSTTSTVPPPPDFEGRIAEMESFMKITTQMMQVRIDVVDSKIKSEIGGLRAELTREIEDKGVEFMNNLKKLDGRTESLEKYLGDLRAKDWLTKEDFDKFLAEFEKSKGLEQGNSDVNLDDIRSVAREIVEKEIEKHAADGLGRVDYAVSSGGGVVVQHSEPVIVPTGSKWLHPSNQNGVHPDAQKMLRPSFGEPGHCFPLKGSCGFVQIRLRGRIIPEAVTLEHVAKSVAYDRSSAPKNCRVSGWLQGNVAGNAQKMHLLTEFTYDLEKSNAQTFNVLDSAGAGVIDTVRFDFSSNHGNLPHTCIYRLRVHGRRPNSVLDKQS